MNSQIPVLLSRKTSARNWLPAKLGQPDFCGRAGDANAADEPVLPIFLKLQCGIYATPAAKTRYRVTGKIDDYLDMYTYDRPAEIVNDFAWAQYFSLLDSTRRRPNFPPFNVTQSLKSQF